MADPVELQIGDLIHTALEAILPGNGYYTDAGKRVSDRRVEIEDLDSTRMPAIYIFSGAEGQPEEQLSGGCLPTKIRFLALGYFKGNDSSIRANGAKLKADLKKALMSNRLWDAKAKRTTLLGVTTDYSEFAPLSRGVVVVSIDVDYVWSLTAL